MKSTPPRVLFVNGTLLKWKYGSPATTTHRNGELVPIQSYERFRRISVLAIHQGRLTVTRHTQAKRSIYSLSSSNTNILIECLPLPILQFIPALPPRNRQRHVRKPPPPFSLLPPASVCAQTRKAGKRAPRPRPDPPPVDRSSGLSA